MQQSPRASPDLCTPLFILHEKNMVESVAMLSQVWKIHVTVRLRVWRKLCAWVSNYACTGFFSHSVKLRGLLERRCRSWKILVCAKDFCLNFPKLARNVLVRLLPTNFIMKTFFGIGMTSNIKVFMCFVQTLGAIFWSQTAFGAIFAQIFRYFAWNFRDFAQIFRNFTRIFDKSKLLGVRLHPLHLASTLCTLASYTTVLECVYAGWWEYVLIVKVYFRLLSEHWKQSYISCGDFS